MTSKICLVCASNQKLKFLPCPNHSEQIESDTCMHGHTSIVYIQNGSGIVCHVCGLLEVERKK